VSVIVCTQLYPCASFQLKTHFSNKFGFFELLEEAAPKPSHIVVTRSLVMFSYFEVHTECQIGQILIVTMTRGIHSEHTAGYSFTGSRQ